MQVKSPVVDQVSTTVVEQKQQQQPTTSRTAMSVLEERQRSIVRQLDSIHGYNDGPSVIDTNITPASYESYNRTNVLHATPVYQQVFWFKKNVYFLLYVVVNVSMLMLFDISRTCFDVPTEIVIAGCCSH